MGFISRLKAMKIQSATTIAVESMKYLLSVKNFESRLDEESRKLMRARPTAVPLYNALERLKRKRSRSEINKIIHEIETAKYAAARNASKIFTHKATVLTHCHSSFVVSAIVRNRQKIKEVIVTETRPRDQGVTTAKELLSKGIKISFIIDSAISDFIKRTDAVVVGADALRKEGLVNKVGTHPLALVAKENGKPFYVVTSSFTIDKRPKIIMEQRPASELAHEDLRGAKIFNPAFDITPWKYVTAIITEKGVTRPGKKQRASP